MRNPSSSSAGIVNLWRARLRKPAVFALTLLTLFPLVLHAAADAGEEPRALLVELRDRLTQRDKSALRDLALLLDRHDVVLIETGHGSRTAPLRELALSLAAVYCRFEGLPIEANLDTATFAGFLDREWDSILFEDLLNAFTETPLAGRAPEYQLRAPRQGDRRRELLEYHLRQLQDHVANARWYPAVQEIEAIGGIDLPEAYSFLTECAAGEHWGGPANDRAHQIYSAIAWGLGQHATLDSARLILDIMSHHEVYSTSYCVNALSKITNHDPVLLDGAEDIVGAYRELLERYPTLEELREAGFRRTGVEREDYDDPVAYYASVIAATDPEMWWIRHNAIRGLLALEDPRALPVVAGLLMRSTYVYNELVGHDPLEPVSAIERVTRVEVAVRDSAGGWSTTYTDPASRESFLAYWVNHAEDWRWDEAVGRFVNTRGTVVAASRYDVLFELLFSEDDDQAMAAFVELTQGEPGEVLRRLPQYDLTGIGGHRQVNGSLPIFAGRFLAQLVQLTALCRDRGLSFEPPESLRAARQAC